jgi:hypothetical protein
VVQPTLNLLAALRYKSCSLGDSALIAATALSIRSMVVEVSRAELWSASVILVFGGSSAQLARPADN